MRVERHGTIDPIAEEWRALAARSAATPFDGPDWLASWWRAFGNGRLELLAARDGDALVGVLPLVQRAGGFHSPTNWHTPAYNPTGTPDGIAAACEAMFARRPAYVRLRFLEQPELLVELGRRAGYDSAVRELQRSPYASLDGGAGTEAGATQKSRTRSRRLAALGEVELDVRDGAAGLDDDLRLAFELEGSGWKTENGTAIVSRPETLRFYEDLARWAARRGLLRLFFLRVDGRPIAVEIVLVAGRRSFDLKGGYDPEFRKYAPGRVMRDLLLAWAEQNGIETHEFLGEPEAWKLERSHGLWTRYELVAVKGRLRGRAARAALVHGRPLVRRARDVAGRLAQRGGAR